MMRSHSAPFGAKVQAANKRLKSNDNKDNILLEVVLKPRPVAFSYSPVTAGHLHIVLLPLIWNHLFGAEEGKEITPEQPSGGLYDRCRAYP
jgi:hypothetical protein